MCCHVSSFSTKALYNHPVIKMASDEDPRSPLEILLIEIWEKVFTNLSGRDLLSCYKTSECWRQELEKRRAEFFMTERVFALISHSLDRDDVLNCRSVCKSWKESVEDSLQNHAAHFKVVPSYTLVYEVVNHELLRSHDEVPHNLNFNFDFMLFRDANFLKSIPEGCHNHFLNRSVSFLDVRATPKGRVVLMKILERFGNHILHFRMTIQMNEKGHSKANTVYQLTRAYLMLMPNLKSLNLSFCPSRGYHIEEADFLMTSAKEELIRSQPLPPLNDLISLTHYGLINPLETAVWQSYGQVGKLALRNEHFNRTPIFKDFHSNARLDRLEELYISPGTLKDFRRLKSVSMNSPWPLRILSVDFLLRDEDTLKPLFRAVSHFGATLRHLGIQLRITGVLNTAFSALFIGRRLNLPRLETLKLTKLGGASREYISSLGFLEPCSSLKILGLSYISQYSLNSLAPILSCPLGTLRLVVLGVEDLGLVLAIVSQLGATLRNLGLYAHNCTDLLERGRPISRLKAENLALPRLETLTILCGTLVIDTLDFIQGCNALRKLVLEAKHTNPIKLSDFPQFIQFRGYFGRMNDSNIWTLLPELQVFKLDMRAAASPDMDKVPVLDGFVEDGRVHRVYYRTGS